MVRIDAPEENAESKMVKRIAWLLVLLFALFLLFDAFYTIESGQEGVLLTFGSADPIAIQPGFHLKIPLVQTIVKFDVRTQKYGVDATGTNTGDVTLESAASSDLQVVKVQLAVNYHIVPGTTPEVFTNIGPNFEWTVIQPTVHEATKAAIAKYDAADLINKREDVRSEIETLLREKLKQYNIVVEQVSITNFDFSAEFNQAIEAKVTAEQQKLKADNDLERIKVEAQQQIVQAEGAKQAAIAQAEGEAQKVKLVQDQLKQSPQYIDYIRANKWNGAYPQYYMTLGGGSQGVTPLLQIPTPQQ